MWNYVSNIFCCQTHAYKTAPRPFQMTPMRGSIEPAYEVTSTYQLSNSPVWKLKWRFQTTMLSHVSPRAICWTGVDERLRLNPIPGGGGAFKTPLQVFLVPLPNAARLKAHTRWLFLNIHCAHFDKKSCRVRSGQVTRGGLVTPPQKSLQSRQS